MSRATKYWPAKPVSDKKVERYRDSIYAYDTETLGLGGEIIFATATGIDGTLEFRGSPSEIVSSSVAWMLSLPPFSTVLIHNLGYDFRYFVEELDKESQINNLNLEIKARTSSSIYGLDLVTNDEKRKPMLFIRDSYAVWGTSLKDFTETFAPDLAKLESPFDYSDRDNPVHFDPSDPTHIEYARRDVESLRQAWLGMSEMFVEHFGILPGNTAAATAVKGWRATLGAPINFVSKTVNLFARSAYIGGLTWNTDTIAHVNASTFDLNSSYPAAMLSGVPSGAPFRVSKFVKNLPGYYRVKVTAPADLRVPIIGKRTDSGVLWPAGTFETTTSSIEITFAEAHGYTFEILEGLVFPELAHPFDEMIDTCRSLRKKYKGQPAEKVAKLLQNSLYGKFGTRPERTSFVRVDEPVEGEVLYIADVEALGDDWLAVTVDGGYSSQMFHWAAWITATARIRLLEAIYRVGVDRVLYCDTDSITLVDCEMPADLVDDTEYGKFKLEKVWEVFRAECPKLYAGILEESYRKKETYKGAAKGLHIDGAESEAVWDAILNGREFVMFDIDTLPSAGVWLKTKKGLTTGNRRSVSRIKNSNGRRVDEEGRVWPINYMT